MRALIASTALVLCAASAADAQTFGSVNLQAGFTPDPYRVAITSGGTIDARADLGGACRGWIAEDMDYALYYTAGIFNLTISSSSEADTTLVVVDSAGNFYCDDDSGPGLDPSVTIRNPVSGVYGIWVGSYRQGEYASATVSISEVGRR